jgi:hypothetical protein
MTVGMGLIGGGILWAAATPVHGRFRDNLAGPFFMCWHRLCLHPRLDRRSRRRRHRLDGGHDPLRDAQARRVSGPAALTGGLQWALRVCGAIGLAGIPITFLLIRRDELAGAAAQQQDPQLAVAAN